MESTQKSVFTRRIGLRRVAACGAALALASTAFIAVTAGASRVAPHALSPGSDIFLSVSGITGDGSAAGGPATIEISSFSWGASNSASTGAGAGGARGKVKVSSVTITKSVDRSSPNFFRNVCAGTHYPTVILSVRKAGSPEGAAPTDAMQITLSDVFVSSYSMGGGGSNETPVESVTLNFTKIKMTYTPENAAPITADWNVKTNKVF